MILLTVNFAMQGPVLPQTFMPGLISTDSVDFNAAFSPDGKAFYFSRAIQKQTMIFFSKKTATGWTPPDRISFSSTKFSDADPAFSPDGELYFISNRPRHLKDSTVDYDIWKVIPLGGSRWSEPINVKELNSERDEFYISFTKNGDVYFSSSREGGYGEEDIYFCRRSNNSFGHPKNVGDKINTVHSEYDPFVAANGSALLFASSGRTDSFGKADLYWSVRSEGGWLEAKHFAEIINSPSRDFCPYISSDLNVFFHSSGGDIKFIPVNALPLDLTAAIKQ